MRCWRVSGGDRGSQKRRRLVVGTGGVTKALTTSGGDRGAHDIDVERWWLGVVAGIVLEVVAGDCCWGRV